MASWFPSTLGDRLNGLKDTVQSKVNHIDPGLIKKLTLRSDELVAERDRIDEEEWRKDAVRDCLAEILPWETRDAEMEILVDECKEAILGLSARDDTFTGPFILPGGLLNGEDGNKDEEGDENRRAAIDLAAAEASAEKLSKLQPLPTLLADFDLDTHVGLIQRLLKVDLALVKTHSRLSSGGQRELAFWKNYFFHCAYARYEAGLSIDEIWSNEAIAARDVANANANDEVAIDSASTAASVESGPIKNGDSTSEGGGGVDDAQPSHATAAQTSALVGGSVPSPSTPRRDLTPKSDVVSPSYSAVESGGGADYEFVASSGGGGDDGSMDELEAEIAAALGD